MMKPEPFEQAEILRAAPPEIRQRYVAFGEVKAARAQHAEIAVSALLHVHRMPEQEADDPRFDVSVGRFGEEQHASGFQHAVERFEGALLLDEMMKRLMAKD